MRSSRSYFSNKTLLLSVVEGFNFNYIYIKKNCCSLDEECQQLQKRWCTDFSNYNYKANIMTLILEDESLCHQTGHKNECRCRLEGPMNITINLELIILRFFDCWWTQLCPYKKVRVSVRFGDSVWFYDKS